MSQQVVSIRLTGDGRSLTVAVDQAARDLDRVSQATASAASATKAVARETEALSVKLTASGQSSASATRSVSEQAAALQRLAAVQATVNRFAGVQDNIDTSGRAADINAYGQSLDQLRAKFSPLFAAEQQHKAQLDEIAMATRTGALSTEESASAVKMATAQYNGQVAVISRARAQVEGHTGAIKMQGYQLANLSQQIQDVGVQLASGSSPFLIMAQQGPQITSAMGGVKNTISIVTQAITPLRVAVAGAAGVVITAAAAWYSYSSAMTEVDRVLQGAGRTLGLTSGQMNEAAKAAARAANISVAAARDMEVQFASTGKIGAASFTDLTVATKSYARMMGMDLDEAAAKLATALADPAKGADTLNAELHFLDDTSREYIRTLASQNDLTGAQKELLDKLLVSVGAGAEKITRLRQAWESFKNAPSNIFDAIGEGIDQRINGLPATIENLQLLTQAYARANSEQNGGALVAGVGILRADEIAEEADRIQQELNGVSTAAKAAKENIASIRAGDAARAVTPGYGELEKLKAQQADLAGALDDPAVAARTADLGQVKAAYDAVTAAITTYMTPAQRAIEQDRIATAALQARTPAQKAQVAADQKRLDMAGQIVSASDTQAAAMRAGTLAAAQASKAATDGARAMSAQTAAAMAVADAYGVSAAAGHRAEMAAQAQSSAMQDGAVNASALTAALLEQAAAQALVEGAQAVAAMRDQADAAESMLAVSGEGARASEEMARRLDVETVRRQALAVATDATREAVELQIAAYDAESLRRLKAQQELADESALRQAHADVIRSAAEAQAAAISDPDQRRQAEIAIARQTKIMELTEQYGTVADGTGQQLLNMWEDATASDEQTRFWDDVREKADGISSDISSFLVDGFVNADAAGQSMFKNMFEGAWAGAKRFFANIVAEALRTQIIMPVVMSVVGSASSILGIVSPSGSGDGGYSASGLTGGVTSLGSSLLSGGLYSQTLAGYGVDFATSSIGQSLGLGSSSAETGLHLSAAGSSFSSALGNMGYGAIGGLGASLLGLGTGNSWADAGLSTVGSIGGSMAATSIASALGAGAAMGAWAGPIGAAVGAFIGVAAGTLFKGKSSVGPAMGISLGADGGLTMARTDNGASQSDADSFGSSISQIAQLALAATGGSFQGAGLAKTEKNGYEVYTNGGRQDTGGDVVAAVRALLLGGIKGGDADVMGVIKRSDASSVEQLVSDAQLAAWVKSAKAANDNMDPIGEALAAQLTSISAAYDAQITRAQQLGIATGELTAARDAEIASAKTAAAAQKNQTDWAKQNFDDTTTAMVATASGDAREAFMAQLRTSMRQSASSALSQLTAGSITQGQYDAYNSAIWQQAAKAIEDFTAAVVRQSRAFTLDLDAREATLNGDDRGALAYQLQAQRDQQLDQARALAEAGTITWEAYDRLSSIIDREVIASLKNFDTQLTAASDATRASAVDNVTAFASSLLMSNLSPLSTAARADLASTRLDELVTSALGGNLSAYQAIPQISQTFLELSDQLYGSTQGSADAFQKVVDALGKLTTISPESLVVESIDDQTDTLGGKLDTLISVMEGLRDEMGLAGIKPARAA